MAGFFYILTKSEALSFTLLKQLISRNGMGEIMNTCETSKLKLNFYRLDRLISICLPDMHQHFKEENLNASLFSTSFFITLFSQVLQTQNNAKNIWKLERIWDFFIVYGWKAIYKVSLIMLRENEERLRASSFEMVLS